MARRLVIDAQFPSNLQVVPPVARQQHNPASQGQLLTRRKGPHQPLQLTPLLVAQHHFRWNRRRHRSFRSNQDAPSYPAIERVPAPFRPPCTSHATTPSFPSLANVSTGLTP